MQVADGLARRIVTDEPQLVVERWVRRVSTTAVHARPSRNGRVERLEASGNTARHVTLSERIIGGPHQTREVLVADGFRQSDPVQVDPVLRLDQRSHVRPSRRHPAKHVFSRWNEALVLSAVACLAQVANLSPHSRFPRAGETLNQGAVQVVQRGLGSCLQASSQHHEVRHPLHGGVQSDHCRPARVGV